MTDTTPTATRISRAFNTASGTAPRRVLVVDDEDAIRLAISKFLRSRGYDVNSASSGAGALELLQQERFDAMVCDIRMPGMTGTQLVPRAIELRPNIAVLMLTAVNDAPTATEVLANGAMDYLMKPIELPDLALAVERALHQRELEIQQRNVERLIREEVAIGTEELRREQQALAQISIGVVRALVNAQEAKDVFLRGHSQRVAASAAAIAADLQLSDDEVEALRQAGRLHDVGKIGVPEALLNKPGALTEEEYARVQDHVRVGIEILAPLSLPRNLMDAIQDHRERWDGKGYPRQLAGERISLGGRILGAADAFDALTSRRAYREPLSPHETIGVLAAEAGAMFDPQVFDALRRVVTNRKYLPFIDEGA
jgi:putative two-component system response regulator